MDCINGGAIGGWCLPSEWKTCHCESSSYGVFHDLTKIQGYWSVDPDVRMVGFLQADALAQGYT